MTRQRCPKEDVLTGAKRPGKQQGMSTELRDRLRLTLLAARVSQYELARVSGIHSRSIARMCRGDSLHVTLPTMIRLANSLGCSIDWLAGRAVQGPTPIAVRHAIGQAGGRVKERAKDAVMDPINRNSGMTSRRGRQIRSVLAPSVPGTTEPPAVIPSEAG